MFEVLLFFLESCYGGHSFLLFLFGQGKVIAYLVCIFVAFVYSTIYCTIDVRRPLLFFPFFLLQQSLKTVSKADKREVLSSKTDGLSTIYSYNSSLQSTSIIYSYNPAHKYLQMELIMYIRHFLTIKIRTL